MTEQRQAYFDYLDSKFEEVTTKEEALDVLAEIKEELMEGIPDLPPKPRAREQVDGVFRFGLGTGDLFASAADESFRRDIVRQDSSR